MQKTLKIKKTKLQTPLGLLSDSVDMWSAIFMFFVFCHWVFSLTLWTCGLQFWLSPV